MDPCLHRCCSAQHRHNALIVRWRIVQWREWESWDHGRNLHDIRVRYFHIRFDYAETLYQFDVSRAVIERYRHDFAYSALACFRTGTLRYDVRKPFEGCSLYVLTWSARSVGTRWRSN